MSSLYKTIHVSPSIREHTCVLFGISQAGCLTHDQGQMLGPELGPVEMSDVEFTHLQHLIQSQMETQAAPPDGPDARSPPAAVTVQDTTGSTLISPFSQAMDLSTSTDEHGLVMPGEKTPISFGEVPGFVLAKVREQDISTDPLSNSSTSSQKRSAARVCLETRFNTVSADTPRQQDVQATVFSNFLTIFQQSAEAPEGVIHPQMQKRMTAPADKTNPYEVSGPFIGSVLNPVTNTFEQVISHIPHRIDPQHQGLIIPKSFSFNFLLDSVVKKAHYTNGNNSAEEQQLENKENDVATSAAFRKHDNTHSSHSRKGAKAAGSGSNIKKNIRAHLSPSQRREKHNSKERERRKRIRLCCDELNMLVPFCNSDTDKVTTLQWTTAYLGYLTKTYGDTFKDEFKRSFIDERGHFVKSSQSSSHDRMKREMDESLTTPLTVEQ